MYIYRCFGINIYFCIISSIIKHALHNESYNENDFQLSYIIGCILFPDTPEMQIGMFFTGVSPSGGASNMWTVLLDGNLNLSITMTTLCTIAAFGEKYV